MRPAWILAGMMGLAGSAAGAFSLSFEAASLREKTPQSLEARDEQGRLSLAPAGDGRYRVWRPISSLSPLLVDATRAELGSAGSRRDALYKRVAALACNEGWACRLERLRLRAASENELLEAYLNLAPYGAQISGAEAAAFVYFDKHADQLTLSEALTLSVLPDQPVRETLLGANPADQLARRKAARRLRGRLKAPASDKRRKAGRPARC